MGPGHSLELVIFVLLSAVTLMVEWQEGHPAHKNPVPLIPEVLLRNR